MNHSFMAEMCRRAARFHWGAEREALINAAELIETAEQYRDGLEKIVTAKDPFSASIARLALKTDGTK